MNILGTIKGQEKAVNYLRNSARKKRVANAYLFVGPDGTGKSTVARGFLAELFCQGSESGKTACGACPNCRRISENAHPDIKWITQEGTARIGIDEIKEIREFLSLKPYESRYSAVVIDNAHQMTQESSNALLKVLEEPPGDSLIILLTNRKEWLLPTIISRAAEVRFSPVGKDDIIDIVMGKLGIEKAEAEFLSSYSGGSPGTAILMAGEDLELKRKALRSVTAEILKKGDPSLAVWPEEDRTNLIQQMDHLLILIRDIAYKKLSLDEYIIEKGVLSEDMAECTEKYSIDRIYGMITKLIALKRAVEGNVNPKLVSSVLPGEVFG
ncbi:MAG: DNA polymerase III subunit delta' [Candidatus Omnitrophica bacterium]|nr:DNA polymerase III subunit delta' [Candidatus Omnitrophota bacterium]